MRSDQTAITMNTPTLLPHPDPSSPVLSHFSLLGKTAVVTGGTRGIGLEVSRGLAEAGASVAILYTSTEPSAADEIAASISKSTGQLVKAYKADVTSATEIGDTINAITSDIFKGHLDIVVANAGIATHYAAEDYTPEQFQEIMNVNLNGAFYTAQAGGRIFKEQFSKTGKQGRVIFTASVSATLVNVPQKQSAYNASKAAVVQLARCLSVEWVGFARVNCISPVRMSDNMMTDKANSMLGIHCYR